MYRATTETVCMYRYKRDYLVLSIEFVHVYMYTSSLLLIFMSKFILSYGKWCTWLMEINFMEIVYTISCMCHHAASYVIIMKCTCKVRNPYTVMTTK